MNRTARVLLATTICIITITAMRIDPWWKGMVIWIAAGVTDILMDGLRDLERARKGGG